MFTVEIEDGRKAPWKPSFILCSHVKSNRFFGTYKKINIYFGFCKNGLKWIHLNSSSRNMQQSLAHGFHAVKTNAVKDQKKIKSFIKNRTCRCVTHMSPEMSPTVFNFFVTSFSFSFSLLSDASFISWFSFESTLYLL